MSGSPSSADAFREQRLEIGNETRELRRVSVWLRERLGDDLSPESVFALDLGLQEAVANTMMHAYPDDGEARIIVVTLRRSADRIEVEVEDEGVPFDPLAAVPPPLPERLEDVVPGGNGIRLMRRFLDVSYRRASGRNHLVLTRSLTTADRP